MRVKHLKVQNFMSLVDVDLSDLPNLVAFIGKNSSGKSNVIDALALLFFEFGPDLRLELGGTHEFQHLFPGHITQTNHFPSISVTVNLTPQDWAEIFSIDQDTSAQWGEIDVVLGKRFLVADDVVLWETSTVKIGNSEVVNNGELILEEITFKPGSESGAPQSISTDQVLSRLAKLLQSSLRVIHTTDNPRSWPNRFSERPTIIDDEHVQNLWDLSQSRGNQRRPWTSMTQQYQEIAPNEQRPVGVASSIQVEEGSLTVPIGMTGEGSQAMLRLLDQLERGSPIMAIEEPETHLHPALIKRIGHLLAETSRENKQLFVCTHSPFLIEHSSLDSFFVVRKEKDGTRASPMRDIVGLKNLLFDIGMRPSDILFSDAILLVEGLSDETFFNLISNKCNVPLAERHVKIMQANGYPRGRRKIEFWAKVGKDAGLPLYLILDKNAADEAESAIEAGQVYREHCLILEKGDLEDYYPWDILQNVLAKEFEIEVAEPIPVGERVEKLRKLLSSKAARNAWKPIVAEEVANRMTQAETETEMREVVDFLHGIHRSLGTE